MRVILYSIIGLSLAFFPQSPSHSQCNFFNPAIKLNRTTSSSLTSACEINLDLYFDLQANAGGKYVYVHIWPKSKYPNLLYNNPPNLTQLTDAVATLGFYHFGGSLYMLDSYTPFPTVSNFKYAGLTIIKSTGTVTGSDRFTIQNITITGSAGCGVAQDFRADVWESQSASAQNVHCFSRSLKFYANDPRASGSLVCGPPRQYRFEVKTIDPAGLTVSHKVYIDNGDGIFNASNDTTEISNSTDIRLSSENDFTYRSPLLDYLPYSNQKPEADRALWIVITSAARDNASYARIDNNCFLLPIQLGAFHARWMNQRAQLEWTTLTESDNKGFDIERKNAADQTAFRPIGFLPSRAEQGNSATPLHYVFTDIEPINSPQLYRLKQIDHSGKISYSPTRLLSAQGLLSQIHPNPANEQVVLTFAKKQSRFEIEWHNEIGQKMGKWQARDRLIIPTHSFPNGTHRIRITDQQTGESESRTILIQHTQ
jgi:hypothetical protein